MCSSGPSLSTSRGFLPSIVVLTLAVELVCPTAYADVLDDSGVAAAYGTVVDSIVVSGNRNTQSLVLLREMETRPGDVLDPDIFKRDLRFIGDRTLQPVSQVYTAVRQIRFFEGTDLLRQVARQELPRPPRAAQSELHA